MTAKEKESSMSTTPQATAGQPSFARRMMNVRVIAIAAAVLLLIAMALSTKVVSATEQAGPPVFNAVDFANENYASSIVPAIQSSAQDLQTLLTAISVDGEKAKADFGHSSNPHNAFSYPVTLTAVAGQPAEDGTSLALTVEGLPPDVTVQLLLVPGTSTALRDVTGQVDLNQFLNQVEYLHASLELNKLAQANVIQPFLSTHPIATIAGTKLRITGTFTNSSSAIVAITPVSIEALP